MATTNATTEKESVEQLAERIENAVNEAAYNNSGCVLLPLGSIAKIVVPMLRNAGTPCATPPAQDAELPAQQASTPDHREKVAKALGELRAEAKRIGGGTFDNLVTHDADDAACLISDDAEYLLRDKADRAHCPILNHWGTAHDAIARANGLQTLAEREAGETHAEQDAIERECREAMRDGKSRPITQVIEELRTPGVSDLGPSMSVSSNTAAPPTDAAVSERDIAAQTEIAQEIFKRISDAEYNKIPTSLFSGIIAKHNAAEREELERREAQLSNEKNTVAHQKQWITDLQAQLAEAQKRVAELERVLQLSDVGAALLDDVLHRIVSDFLAKEPQPAAQRGEGRE